jgi:hypothetical protein
VLRERKEGEEIGLLRRHPVLNVGIIRNSRVKENVGRS